MIHSKQHRGCRIQDPGTCGYRWWKTADFFAPRTVRPQRMERPVGGGADRGGITASWPLHATTAFSRGHSHCHRAIVRETLDGKERTTCGFPSPFVAGCGVGTA